MTGDLDPARWQRYHDKELDQAETDRADRELPSNPAARAHLDELAQADALVTAALSEAPAEPLAPERRAAIESLVSGLGNSSPSVGPVAPVAPARPTPRAWAWPQWAMPALAASLAAFILGVTGGFYIADQRQEALIARIEMHRESDRVALAQAVTEALESKLSGATVAWHNPGSGTSGSITPVRTFRNRDGRWCREYEKQVQGEGWGGGLLLTGSGSERVIACREDDGRWVTRLIATTDS